VFSAPDVRSQRDQHDNHQENQEHDARDAHQTRVGDVTRAFRLDAGNRRDRGNQRGGNEPRVPGHAAQGFKSQADPEELSDIDASAVVAVG